MNFPFLAVTFQKHQRMEYIFHSKTLMSLTCTKFDTNSITGVLQGAETTNSLSAPCQYPFYVGVLVSVLCVSRISVGFVVCFPELGSTFVLSLFPEYSLVMY